MSFCTNRSAEQPSGAGFGERCGFNLQARPAQAPVVPESDQRVKGLANLRWSFLFFMVGGALTFVPFIGLIASLFYIVALVFLIIGWRDLGRSTLAEAPRYKSTGSWLIYSIVIAVVVAVIGSVTVFFLFLSSALASGITPPNPQVLVQGQAFRNLLGEVFAVAGAASVAFLFAWYRIITSLMRLADEVSQPRLRTAGWLFLALAVFGVVSFAVFSAMLYTGVISFPTPTTNGGLGAFNGIYYYLSFARYGGVVIFVLSFVNQGLLILGSYMGYKGLKGALLG